MGKHTAEDILNQPKVSLIEVYLQLQQHYEERFGPNAVVVMEVGSFFEVYGVDNDTEKIGKPKEIAEILNLQLTRKNKSIPHNDVKNPLLAGFPGATFDRYIGRLVQENTYTIIIVRQKGDPPNVERYVDRILSPGINFDYRNDHEEQVLVSLLIDRSGKSYSVGYAAADVTTGRTSVFEAHGTAEDPTAGLDAAFHLLQSRRTQEILITVAQDQQAFVQDYLELQSGVSVMFQDARLEVAFQNELLGQAFGIASYLTSLETLDLEKSAHAGEALAQLVKWIVEHERSLAEQLHRPAQLQHRDYMYMGNNPLHQLGMLSHDPHEPTVLELLDQTRTSIGRRLLKDRITHPITDATEMEARYDMVDAVASTVEAIDQQLRQVYDIERLSRRLSLGRLHPFELNFLFDSLEAADNIIDALPSYTLAALKQLKSFQDDIKDCIKQVKTHFSLSETGKVSRTTIATSFFKPGFDETLDTLLAEQHAYEEKLEHIRAKLTEMIFDKTGKDAADFVTIKQLDKEGHYISLTKSRYALIEDLIPDAFISIDETVHAFSDFHFKVQTGNVKITATLIDELSQQIVVRQRKIAGRVRELYAQELTRMHERYGTLLSDVSHILAAIDVACSTAKAAQALRLTRPTLIHVKPHENYLEIASLRHPLVEKREEHGIYVPNHVLLGATAHTDEESHPMFEGESDARGMLLYGINASGKSSYMKAIGIAVMLAQAGLFVPASRMRFAPFSEMFTRIVAKDNIERGLSSFAVEMMELKNIFTRSSAKSLILGDEICRGTETLSAIAIVSAAVKRLSEIGSVFLFTTHLHQLANLDVFSSLPHVLCAHLSVRYDEEKDLLIFDRKLQPGSGSSIYGLEFAQSLHMDEQFLKDATQIRKHLANDFDQLELLTKKVKSAYNKELFLSTCSLCQNKAEETHHISPQEIADKHGNIDHFHKNHKANLITLCDACHDNIHHGKVKVNGYVMTSKGLMLDIEEIS